MTMFASDCPEPNSLNSLTCTREWARSVHAALDRSAEWRGE